MNASDPVWYTSSAGSIRVDALHKQVLTVANQLLALPKYGAEEEPMTATQGSWRPVTSYSGTTHTGCAAVDLTAYNWRNRVTVLDLLGDTGCRRTPSQGNWPYHIHTMLRGMACASSSLKAQIAEVRAGGDGLAGSKPDPDAALRSGLWPLAVFAGRVGKLAAAGGTTLHDGPASSRKIIRTVPKGTVVTALMEVNRLGKIWFVTTDGEWGYSPKWVKA